MSEQQLPKSSDDGLRQRLTEFIYGLLPDEESAALNERIASDPKVARIYAEVKLDTDLFAKAARLEEKQLARKMRLARPAAAAGVSTSGARRSMTPAHWVLALAAAVLIAVTLGGWAYQEATEQSIADKHLHLVVSGPARLKQGIDNQFQISTRTVDGNPVAADLEYTIASAAGEELYSNLRENNPLRLIRDDRGDAILTIPASIELPANSRLEIRAFHEQSRPRMTQSLPVDEDHFVTWLSLDKPWYQPGETVSYRSLTLTRFSLNAKQEQPVQYEILDPGGAPVADSASQGVTHNGVGNGGWQIPDSAAGGQYTIVCRSVDDSFPEQTKQFLIRRYALPRLKKELEFARDTYTPGDEVVADVSVNRAEGDAAAEAPIRIIATVDDVEVFNAAAELSTTGTYQVKFPLPAEMEQGDGQLAVIVDDGGTRETIARTIPINLGKVDVQFFPEGGDLVAGVENRVYFVAKNPQGEPVHIEGQVVDANGKQVADFATMHEGLGKLAFTPADGAAYHVKIVKPADITSQPTLPAVNAQATVAINTGDGVFAAGEHPALTIHATEEGVPLVIAAVCRGTAVGQTRHVTTAGQPQNIVVPVNDAAEGVVRLTVFDYSTQPATPLAERLVYRRPNRKLNVEINAASARYAPGQQAEVHLRVTDEEGRPIPATMGVSVVDDALLSLKRETDKHKLVAMPTHFLLTTEVDKPEDLEDANFFLSDEPDAAGALDLLLGTQGWRRFAEQTREELLQDDIAAAAAPGGEGSEPSAAATQLAGLDRLVAMDGEIVAPAAFDNLATAQSEYQAELAAYQARRQEFYNTFGKIAFGGGLLLIFAVAVMALSRVASRMSFWAPTLAASVACLLVGAFWIARDVDGNLSLSPQALFRSQEDRTVAMAPASEAMPGQGLVGNEEFELFDDAVQFDAEAEVQLEGAQEMAVDDPAAAPADEALVEAGAELPQPAGPLPPPAELAKPLDIAPGEPFADADFADAAIAEPAPLMADEPVVEELRELNRREAQMGLNGKLAGKRRQDALQGERWRQAEPLQQVGMLRQNMRAAAQRGDEQQVLLIANELKQRVEQLRFPVREYAHAHIDSGQEGVRSDFTETLYWNPLLIADADGRATIRFDLSDAVTSFRVMADAHTADPSAALGRIGTGEGEIVSKIPFSLEPKLPLEVNAGDRIDLPLAVNNDTNEPLAVKLSADYSELFKLVGEPDRHRDLAAGQRDREYFTFEVVGQKGAAELQFNGAAGAHSDGIRKTIQVVPPGFEVAESYAGNIDGPQELFVKLPDDWVPGSLEVTLQAYPGTLANLQNGLDSILREPHGCFEQASSSNYPNVLALQYMEEHNVASPDVTRRAKQLLDNGYGKLAGYESPERGFEWFGGNPGHEALTAYGLMEFRDMREVYDVDEAMIQRTADWLLARRDGKGGYQRNARALDSFGRAPQHVTDAYITWALSEGDSSGMDKEIEHVVALAEQSEDPYVVALAAASAANAGHAQADALLKKLAGLQQEDGKFQATETSITSSGGLSLDVETTSLAALALLKRPEYRQPANQAMEWITASRQGGGFGATQSTILALKAMVEHAKANRGTNSGGELRISVAEKPADETAAAGAKTTASRATRATQAEEEAADVEPADVEPADAEQAEDLAQPADEPAGRVLIGSRKFTADQEETIRLDGVEAQLTPGENNLVIELTGENKMPYALDITYRTHKPISSDDCAVRLETLLGKAEVAAGETVSLKSKLANVTDQGQPMTVAIIGIPAGLKTRPDQLDELVAKGVIDYYETRAREVICYWRDLAPSEEVEVRLDLIAEIPGQYQAPASRAYLYYTPELKHWVEGSQVTITRD